ncbi:MAG: glycolate oxidase subunit GlcE [Hydrogenophilales bacterium 16-64-46]|nr:MAG: glycolate oxidase subunit GlcE [Hydrogenophilales bacterium 12-64-13]OYZ06856.1 MAG: glycolate oxidase subunit GlcE [Hydrogenophilales bacterium 16-64-46]OZA37000.1 MAG: glycolate oxidase subunit GlcE [Hydrogenophilales bacterium 17-64-34]
MIYDTLIDRIRAAHDAREPLVIRGHGSKDFYGNATAGAVLDTAGLSGIVSYDPRELVLVARAGTALAEIEATLAEHGQMLAFEPPQFDVRGTLGGAVAAGLSGPRRVTAGAVRDFVLGVELVDGTGQRLRFGGRVIKNVAGYDVSRLMVGALGTLGVLTEIALKVLPRPAEELSLQFECGEADAILKMNQWAGQPLPLSATSWHAGLLTVRLSGAHAAVHAAHARLGGEPLAHADEFWARLRDHRAAFFATRHKPLWRIALPSTAPALMACRPELEVEEWIEWGGGLRWIACGAPPERVRNAAHQLGGHATRFSPGSSEAFAPLSPALAAIHRALKQRFDPQGILNRGRMYPDF